MMQASEEEEEEEEDVYYPFHSLLYAVKMKWMGKVRVSRPFVAQMEE